MPDYFKKIAFRMAAACLLVNLLLAACGSGDISPTANSQNAAAATAVITTAKPTTPATTIAASPTATQPVFSGLAQGRLKEMYPVLAGLVGAKKFQIEDDWNGLSTDAPRIFHYSFELKGDKFEGEGFHSTGGFNRIGSMNNLYFEAKLPITIPLDVGQKFLQMLAEAQVEDGPYKGKAITNATDNYPNLYIFIETEYGWLQYKNPADTNSGVTSSFFFKGREFNDTNNAGGYAYKFLEPYLQKVTLRKMSQAQGPLTKTPQPTGSGATPTVRK